MNEARTGLCSISYSHSASKKALSAFPASVSFGSAAKAGDDRMMARAEASGMVIERMDFRWVASWSGNAIV